MNAYVLPGMRLKGQAGRTRGASLFAWHGANDLLAVAVKRRWVGVWHVLGVCSVPLAPGSMADACYAAASLAACLPACLPAHVLHSACLRLPASRVLLFKYDGLEFVEQREVALPDAPTSLQLAGATTLYAGLAKRHAGCCCHRLLLPLRAAPLPPAVAAAPAHSPTSVATDTPACLPCLQGVCGGGCGYRHSHPAVCHKGAGRLHGGGIAHRWGGDGGALPGRQCM